MSKRNTIIYWVFTLWASLGMVSTAIVQLMRAPAEVENMQHLGYPIYFLTLLGTWKCLGVIAILIPRFPLLKEWAYAGFVFAMSGATISRLACGDAIAQMFPSLLLLTLVVISWYFRPADRRVQSLQMQVQ